MDKYDILGYIAIIFILGVCVYIYKYNNGDFDLKCIVSTVDGNQYCVREREKLEEAYKMSTINRSKSDELTYQAEQILREIENEK